MTRYLREIFESDELLQDAWVQGEISNLSRPPSGHLYFTLKDHVAALRCVVWRNVAARLPIPLREGLAVEIHGSLSIYESTGQYQLYADLLRPSGEGRLYQEFLRLKALLEAEGLFDAARKRPLPPRPSCIGIVTSSSGAALRDIINTLRRRYPLIKVILAHTPVQGVEAPAGIITALNALNQDPDIEVIIIARGGGSIEDLSAFNDEQVVRAIAASPKPTVSGIGHEIDFTIADFVSDLRAPTPTAAAELVTPDRQELKSELAVSTNYLEQLLTKHISKHRWELRHTVQRLQARSPSSRVRSQRQQVDEKERQLSALVNHQIALHRIKLEGLQKGLVTLNPMSILNRGYALLSTEDGRIISHAAQSKRGDKLSARLQDGFLKLIVDDIELPDSRPHQNEKAS